MTHTSFWSSSFELLIDAVRCILSYRLLFVPLTQDRLHDISFLYAPGFLSYGAYFDKIIIF